jgi:molybdopterin synthase sulfur carrier subunit
LPQVFIPPQMRDLVPGSEAIHAEGATVRAIVEQLDGDYPGLKARFVDENGRLKPGINVSINGAIASLGLRQPVSAGDEIHFLPAIGGG